MASARRTGGAMTSAVILGMIVTMFPQPSEQAKAIGVYAFVASAGGSVGLLAGGALTQAIDWHWIFFINVPIGIATATFGRRLLAADTGLGLSKGADLPGAALITGALMLGAYTIVKPAAQTAGARRRRSSSAPPRSPCWPPSLTARREPPRRWCRCGSSARATWPARTSSRC